MNGTIFITGAGKRVGLHLALRLLEEGFDVVAHYRTPTSGVETLRKAGATVLRADLTDLTELRRLVAEIRAATTSLRAIVHNASAFSKTAENLDEDVALFERFFRVHMLAPYVLNRELLDLLRASPQKLADIVHLTDIYAERPNPDFATYCATKAGLANLTRSLAKRYAPDVKVNAIAPGPILFREEHSEENRRAVLSKTPLGVEGGPEAIYLALRAVLDNYYITGAIIPVDGGRSLAE